MRYLASAFFFLVLVSSLQANVILVPDNEPTIQGGINVAADGDTVMVMPGTYYEYNIDFLGKAITVMGTDPEDSAVVSTTVVSGRSLGIVFVFQSAEGSMSVLAGLTIKGGYATKGGGIYCYESSPTITNCTLRANSATDYGGGMYNESSSPTVINCNFLRNSTEDYGGGGGMQNVFNSNPVVTNCTFKENSAHWNGGGIYNYESSPTIENCVFKENSALYGGGMYNSYSLPEVNNCVFKGNAAVHKGGGMENDSYSRPVVNNCTFTENSADCGGGMENDWYSRPVISNCTFTGNSALNGGGMCNSESGSAVFSSIFWANSGGSIYGHESNPIVVTYSDVEGGWEGEGNIDANPFFVDPDNGDYHLSSDSPCIDSGADAGVYADFEGDIRPAGNGFDMGVDESPYSVALNLTLTPGDSLTVPPGGTLAFRALIQNNTDNSMAGDYWLSILLPNSNEMIISQAFLNHPNPLNGQSPANFFQELLDEADIPGNAPVGSYEMIGRIGIYPNIVIDESSFEFEVAE